VGIFALEAMNHYPTHREWSALGAKERQDCTTCLAEQIHDQFRMVRQFDANDLPVFQHRPSNIFFRLVLGGEFEFGFSQENEQAARAIQNPPPITLSEVRPTVKYKMGAFLMGLRPLLWNECRGFSIRAVRPAYRSEFSAASLDRHDCITIGNALGCRLPSEVEWEYACRASSSTLFVWGDALLEADELSKWLKLDFTLMDQICANDFGLYGLFTGEWCLDEFRESHESHAKIRVGTYVVKGGGAIFWPWQADEWVWCAPAMRMASTGLLDGTCGCRFCFPLVKGSEMNGT
jgi:hypothetical protein